MKCLKKNIQAQFPKTLPPPLATPPPEKVCDTNITFHASENTKLFNLVFSFSLYYFFCHANKNDNIYTSLQDKTQR